MSKQQKKEQPELKKQAHGKRLNAAQRDAFKMHTIDLYLKGWSYRKIVQSIEDNYGHTLSLPTIGNYVRGMVDEWRKERIEKLDDLKTVELQRINRLEETYWDAWMRSMEAHKRTMEKQKAAPGKSVGEDGAIKDTMNVLHAEKTVINHENVHGDPRYLAGIQWCISMRCKILGIEAPIEFKGTMTSEIKRTTVFKTRTRQKP